VITRIVRDAVPLPVDCLLMGELSKRLRPSRPLEDRGLAFGVEDSRGTVYRIIETGSVWEAARIFEAVRRLGFEIAPGRKEPAGRVIRVFRWRLRAGRAAPMTCLEQTS
jgi:hypothetical protein